MAKSQRNRDIWNICIVLGAAVICAGLLASFFLYYYGPSGRYLVGNTLLDPSIMDQIHYQDQHPQTGKKNYFVFEQVEFSYFDLQTKKMKNVPLSLKAYQTFYEHVANEKSLDVTADLQHLFLQSQPALLTIRMRAQEEKKSGLTMPFQVVQFIPEDYFRIQLHAAQGEEWVYFYQPGLYREIFHLFNP